MPEARRTIDLLWFPDAVERRRGRRQGLTVPRVVETGIAIADREGLEAVTMRRVAQELGVVPMTLYTYVPDKATLLELMLDRLYLAMPRAAGPERPWRERLAAVAEEKPVYAEHPWAAELPAARPPLGPGLIGEIRARAARVRRLRARRPGHRLGAHLPDRLRAGFRPGRGDHPGRDSAQRDERHGVVARARPHLRGGLRRGGHPHATRVGAAAGAALGAAFSPGHAYEFGLERVLDGLGVLIDAAGASDPRR